MTNRFDTDTALAALGGGRFRGRMDRGWWIERGPNGGYVAALVLRGLQLAVDDRQRTPRSLTVHYLAPPQEGEVTMETTVERRGRTATFVSGRLLQGERLLALALGAFSAAREGPEFSDIRPPMVVPPEDATLLDPTISPSGFAIPMRERYEQRSVFPFPVLGAEARPAAEAVVGGWIRLRGPRPVDHLLVAAYCDAWPPPVFARLATRVGVPTVDLTIHFRSALPPSSMVDGDYCLAIFRSQMAASGFVEEDGEIWSADGVLLAHSRQLATLVS